MVSISLIEDIERSLLQLLEEAKDNPEMNEDTLRSKFYREGILEKMGYSDKDIFLEERLLTGKRTDIHCTDEFGDVVFIIEFKKPKVTNLKEFENDLWGKYVKPLKAKYGLLYNGQELLFYERKGNKLVINNELSRNIEDLSRDKLPVFIDFLEKPDYDTTKIEKVIEYLEKFKAPEDRLALEDEISRDHFYESFKLKRDSLFSSLVSSIIELFKEERKTSRFTGSAYEFWKRSYAKELTKSQIPENWRPIFEETGLSPGQKEDRFVLTFCLETAFAFFMRLILTKSCEDFGFPDARFTDFLEGEVKKASRGTDIAQSAYPKMTIELIREMQGKLISSVFEEDIFYWWTEQFDERQYADFFKRPTIQMSKFGRDVARILLSIYKFDFSRIEGDPLGLLYQKYFDTETRKALGEFYTPKEIVDYILDSVGYRGEKVLDTTLLDPACGSGTFLVESLKRYLEGAEQKASQEGWGKVLDDICNKYQIAGFDIHPFATIMAQIQFTLVLLPKYKEAREDDSGFVLKRLPIFRTDSLAKEKETGRMKIEDFGIGQVFSMSIELPVQIEKTGFFEEPFRIPDDKTVFDHTDISTLEDYFGALQAVFDTIKEIAKEEKYSIDLQLLERNLSYYLTDKKWNLLAKFFEGYSNTLLSQIKKLKTVFDDGRLIKSIEDVMLAALLKNFVSYDFVVGNPPYVRIQDIPEKQKKRWSGSYKWTEGNYDIYIPFIERGLGWLKENGKLSYIVSNRFLLTNYGYKMRENLPKKASIQKIVDLKDSRVFKDALNYPAIFVFSKGEREKTYFPAARVFKDPEEGKELFEDIENNLQRLKLKNDHLVGKYSDTFYFQYKDLTPQGWYLMPSKELRVFNHLNEVSSGSLESFTDSEGGFQGYVTGRDAVYVLKIIEERKETIVAHPKGGGEPVEIEKELVRPFLFGKDIDRWTINWKGWYVIYPYKEYIIDDEKKYRQIPSKEYKEKFSYGDRYIEDMYPNGWEYLKSVEDELRKREKGRYKKGEKDEYKWYGAARAQNKEKYDKKKILVQTLSDKSDFVYDENENFTFAGAGGSNIFGVIPNRDISAEFLLSLLNSHLLEYYHKHISNIFAGKSYSYGDQFIKLLPIKTPSNSQEKKLTKRITELAKKLTTIGQLKRKIEMFPTQYFSELTKEGKIKEFFEIRHTTKRYYDKLMVDSQDDHEGKKLIKLGKDDYIEDYKINSTEKYEYVIKAIDGKKFSKNETTIIRVPKSNERVKEILERYKKDKKRLDEMPSKKDLEGKLNNLVYELYGLNDEKDIEIVTKFLDTF